MSTFIISKKIRDRRLRKMERWDAPTILVTTYVHGWQTPTGHVHDSERSSKKTRWVAMTVRGDVDTESPGRYRSEVFETEREAREYVEAYFARSKELPGWQLKSAYVVPTVVVRKYKSTYSPVDYALATPERIVED